MPRMIGNLTDKGPGGRDCPCCAPAPRYRTQYRRSTKRAERNQWKKEIHSA